LVVDRRRDLMQGTRIQLAMGGATRFSPSPLFANGRQGCWLDPSDLSTMFQDAAGTIPCAVDAVVGLIRDKSGRGHDASQSTDSRKPILRSSAGRYRLAFDGSNDFLVTNSIDMSASDALTVWLAIEKLSDAAAGVVMELSTNTSSGSNLGSFYVAAPEDTGASGNFSFKSRGSIDPTPVKSGTVLSPAKRVITAIGRISTDTQIMRVNGVQAGTSSSDQGTGNYGSYPLFIGARSGPNLPFNGDFYGGILLSGVAAAVTISQTEAWLASKCGESLS
jgi:hypothetical protein